MAPQRVHTCAGWEMRFNLNRIFFTFWLFLGWICPFAILVRALFSSWYPQISPNIPKHRKYSKISPKFNYFTLSFLQNKKCNIWPTPPKSVIFNYFTLKSVKKRYALSWFKVVEKSIFNENIKVYKGILM